MNEDRFERAAKQADAAEQARQDADRERRQARLESGSRTAFRIHATVYAAVNLLLIAVWLSVWQLNDGPSYPWFIWVLLGWGIGLSAHYAAARNHLRAGATGGTLGR